MRNSMQGNGSISWPRLGFGIGLRTEHFDSVAEAESRVDWFEAISENFMATEGKPISVLEALRRKYPIALHGVSLSIGSTDSLNKTYLRKLKQLVKRIEPASVSDHLCWTGVDGENIHDLLPLPYTREAMDHVVRRIEQVQEFLGRRILLENVSSYITYEQSEMPEWDFLAGIAKRSGCGLLVDLNNVYVNAVNHGFEAAAFLDHIPAESVAQFHLAGHTDMGDYLFDTHAAPVTDPVWRLYEKALEKWGPISTLIEWDEDIPPISRVIEEADHARSIANAQGVLN